MSRGDALFVLLLAYVVWRLLFKVERLEKAAAKQRSINNALHHFIGSLSEFDEYSRSWQAELMDLTKTKDESK